MIPQIGEPFGEDLEMDRSEYDYRRVFVSNYDVVGRRLADLHLPQRLGAIVSRVRRGDIDLLASAMWPGLTSMPKNAPCGSAAASVSRV